MGVGQVRMYPSVLQALSVQGSACVLGEAPESYQPRAYLKISRSCPQDHEHTYTRTHTELPSSGNASPTIAAEVSMAAEAQSATDGTGTKKKHSGCLVGPGRTRNYGQPHKTAQGHMPQNEAYKLQREASLSASGQCRRSPAARRSEKGLPSDKTDGIVPARRRHGTHAAASAIPCGREEERLHGHGSSVRPCGGGRCPRGRGGGEREVRARRRGRRAVRGATRPDCLRARPR